MPKDVGVRYLLPVLALWAAVAASGIVTVLGTVSGGSAETTGRSEQILDQLSADPVLAQVSELRLELPYEFNRGEYKQILHDASHLIVPELSWLPVSDAPLSAPPGIAEG
jgi:hypothetical protein